MHESVSLFRRPGSICRLVVLASDWIARDYVAGTTRVARCARKLVQMILPCQVTFCDREDHFGPAMQASQAACPPKAASKSERPKGATRWVRVGPNEYSAIR